MSKIFGIHSRLTELPASPEAPASAQNNTPAIEILTPAEAASNAYLQEHGFMNLKYPQEIHFCKAEVHMDFLYGTFVIPPKGKNTHEASFRYAVFKDRIIFIDDGDYVLRIVEKIRDSITRPNPGIGFFFADFLDALISEDLLCLTDIENQIAHLEDEVLSGTLDNFNHKIMSCRRKILIYSHYYLQLSDISNVLQQNDHGFFNRSELNAFRLFSERVGRLHEEALMLREYSTQIREVYQSQIDIRQNKIMKILTVVTTVFLPLTLIAGWYGMNFKYMPELNWKYGYLTVFLLSLAIVILCIRLCRKKHFL